MARLPRGHVDNVAALFAGMGPVSVLDADGSVSSLDGVGLDEAGRRLASGLSLLGIGPGDRVGCWLPNGVAYLTVLAACARLGAVAVAVNTRFRSAEVEDIVGRSGCRALFVHPGFVGIDTEGILERLDPTNMAALECVVPVVDDIETHWQTTPLVQLMDEPASTADNAAPHAPFAVFTTSGTTSAPKLVLHRQASIVDHSYDVAAALQWVASDTALLTLPLCGVFGLTSFAAGAAAQSSQVVCARFDAGQAARVVAEQGVTVMHATDDMVHRMLAHGGDWSTLRYTGFGRFNNALADLPERAADAGWPLMGLYGMSEVQALYARRDPSAPFDERTRSGGRLVSPAAAARVVEPVSGEPVAHGVDGELQLKGPSRFAGYLRDGGDEIDASLTASHLTPDGWFRTGDLARMEDDETFEYLARMGDVLRLGGFLVSPAEIEDRMLQLESVEAVQVVAVDAEQGPRVVAFVRGPVSQFDEQTIITHCRNSLAAFKVPRRVIHLDEFPMTDSANGLKIQKVKLRDLAALHLGA